MAKKIKSNKRYIITADGGSKYVKSAMKCHSTPHYGDLTLEQVYGSKSYWSIMTSDKVNWNVKFTDIIDDGVLENQYSNWVRIFKSRNSAQKLIDRIESIGKDCLKDGWSRYRAKYSQKNSWYNPTFKNKNQYETHIEKAINEVKSWTIQEVTISEDVGFIKPDYAKIEKATHKNHYCSRCGMVLKGQQALAMARNSTIRICMFCLNELQKDVASYLEAIGEEQVKKINKQRFVNQLTNL